MVFNLDKPKNLSYGKGLMQLFEGRKCLRMSFEADKSFFKA